MKNRILFIAVLACWLTGSSLALAVPKLVLVNEFHTVRTFDNSHNTPASTKPTHPSSRWVEQRYGSVPENAVVFTNKNNFSTYYCRGTYRNKVYYGVLYPFIGCYIT